MQCVERNPGYRTGSVESGTSSAVYETFTRPGDSVMVRIFLPRRLFHGGGETLYCDTGRWRINDCYCHVEHCQVCIMIETLSCMAAAATGTATGSLWTLSLIHTAGASLDCCQNVIHIKGSLHFRHFSCRPVVASSEVTLILCFCFSSHVCCAWGQNVP